MIYIPLSQPSPDLTMLTIASTTVPGPNKYFFMYNTYHITSSWLSNKQRHIYIYDSDTTSLHFIYHNFFAIPCSLQDISNPYNIQATRAVEGMCVAGILCIFYLYTHFEQLWGWNYIHIHCFYGSYKLWWSQEAQGVGREYQESTQESRRTNLEVD